MIKVNIKFGKLVCKNHNQLTALRIFTKAWCLYNAVDSCNIWVLGVTLMLAWQAVTWAARALCTWQKSLMLVEEEPPTFLWSQICSSVDIGGHEQISIYNLQSIHLKEVKWREHPGQVAVVDDEEVCNFPGLDVDGRFGFYPVSAREVGGLKDWILDIDIKK